MTGFLPPQIAWCGCWPGKPGKRDVPWHGTSLPSVLRLPLRLPSSRASIHVAVAGLCSTAQRVGRRLEAASCRGGGCCFPAGTREKVSLREGTVLTATGSRCLAWGSIETGRKLSLLPPADFTIGFFYYYYFFPAVAVGSSSDTSSIEKQRGCRAPSWRPCPCG